MDNENNNNQVDEKLNQQNGTVEGNEGTGKVDNKMRVLLKYFKHKRIIKKQ